MTCPCPLRPTGFFVFGSSFPVAAPAQLDALTLYLFRSSWFGAIRCLRLEACLLLHLESPSSLSLFLPFSLRVSHLPRTPPISFVFESSFLSYAISHHLLHAFPSTRSRRSPLWSSNSNSSKDECAHSQYNRDTSTLYLESPRLRILSPSFSGLIPRRLLHPPFRTQTWRIWQGFLPQPIYAEPSRNHRKRASKLTKRALRSCQRDFRVHRANAASPVPVPTFARTRLASARRVLLPVISEPRSLTCSWYGDHSVTPSYTIIFRFVVS